MLQDLKSIIRSWVKERKADQFGNRNAIVRELGDIDKLLDSGNVSDHILLKRVELTRQLHDLNVVAFQFEQPSPDQIMDLDSNISREEIRKTASVWSAIIREVQALKDIGFDFMSHCKKRIGDGCSTKFWLDKWNSDVSLCDQFPRMYALELEKDISVANKLGGRSIDVSFRRRVRDGVERDAIVKSEDEKVAHPYAEYIDLLGLLA
ncbi:transmembrane protein [Artemisia annua]|uniref:Transmembrane protein n=1 Tax=Artemisia annua TaxID=35608 RepID=A0A2U1M8R0_ARTAN|nr:transmembrane protein [Artemisia annua]